MPSDARARLPDGRRARRLARRRLAAAPAAGRAGRDRRQARAGADGGRRAVRSGARGALPRRPPVHEPHRPPALLRVRAVRRDLAGSARRLRRERVQRLRGLVDGVGRPDAAGAGGPRLVQGLGRLPGRGGGVARHRRLGREPDRARLRARDPDRLDERRPRDLRLRSGALFARTGRADARLPARPGAGPARRRGPAAEAVDARRRDRGRRGRRAAPVSRGRERGRHERRRGRPARGAGLPLPASTGSGCTSTPRTVASPS